MAHYTTPLVVVILIQRNPVSNNFVEICNKLSLLENRNYRILLDGNSFPPPHMAVQKTILVHF